MRVLVTGSRGFIGKNLLVCLAELENVEVNEFTRGEGLDSLAQKLNSVDVVIHLAGENRPENPEHLVTGNVDLTRALCAAIERTGRKILMIFASSRHAVADAGAASNELISLYGKSKRAAEIEIEAMAKKTGCPVAIYRLPGVFGKWSRPNYNSVVATFCNNIANDLPIQINAPDASISLVYVDDVVTEFVRAINSFDEGVNWPEIAPEYEISLGDLASLVNSFKASRTSLLTERVGTGITRALYATYISYLSPNTFVYEVPSHTDPRGVFVEMLKTPDCGQFSYFTALPGVTRGEHYHHSKTEKFLVIKGTARFGFRHILTGETHDLIVHGGESKIVDTVPGWTHNISNVGDDEMIVMLWANENYDPDRPDTIPDKV